MIVVRAPHRVSAVPHLMIDRRLTDPRLTSLLGARQVARALTAKTRGMEVVARYMRRMRLTGRVSRQAR